MTVRLKGVCHMAHDTCHASSLLISLMKVQVRYSQGIILLFLLVSVARQFFYSIAFTFSHIFGIVFYIGKLLCYSNHTRTEE